MDRTNQGTKTTTTLGGKARKILLGLGVVAVAGVVMSAAPAMANDRGGDRDRNFDRHERAERDSRRDRDDRDSRHDRDERDSRHDRDERDERGFRRDRDDRGFRRDRDERESRGDERRVVIEREASERVWFPARYEFRSRMDCGRLVTETVLVEAGHWVIR